MQLDTIAQILFDQKSKASDFDEIKRRYLMAADTYKEFNIPKLYKQDNEIRRALFELQSGGVLLQDNDGNYRLKREETASEIEDKLSKNEQRTKNTLNEYMNNMLSRIEQQQKETLDITNQRQTENVDRFIIMLQQIQGSLSEAITAQDEKIELYYNEEKMHKDIQKSALELIARRPGGYTFEEACVEIMDSTKRDRIYIMIQLINLMTSGIVLTDENKRLRIAIHQIRTTEQIPS